MSRRLLTVGFACCALGLLIWPSGVGALVIGIIAVVGGRVDPGTALVVLRVVLPIVGTISLEEHFAKPCGGAAQCDLPRDRGSARPLLHDGRHRGSSDDSRFWAPVPTDAIVGRAVLRSWPSDRVGGP